MAAGAARHGARKPASGTSNTLQAFGVAGGGLVAVTLMTILVGGPADPARADGFPDLAGVTDGSGRPPRPRWVPVRRVTDHPAPERRYPSVRPRHRAAVPPGSIRTIDRTVRHLRTRRGRSAVPARRPRPRRASAAVTPSPDAGKRHPHADPSHVRPRPRRSHRRPEPVDPKAAPRHPQRPPTATHRTSRRPRQPGPATPPRADPAGTARESVRAAGRCTAYWP